jgi:hypothetical protein
LYYIYKQQNCILGLEYCSHKQGINRPIGPLLGLSGCKK